MIYKLACFVWTLHVLATKATSHLKNTEQRWKYSYNSGKTNEKKAALTAKLQKLNREYKEKNKNYQATSRVATPNLAKISGTKNQATPTTPRPTSMLNKLFVTKTPRTPMLLKPIFHSPMKAPEFNEYIPFAFKFVDDSFDYVLEIVCEDPDFNEHQSWALNLHLRDLCEQEDRKVFVENEEMVEFELEEEKLTSKLINSSDNSTCDDSNKEISDDNDQKSKSQ